MLLNQRQDRGDGQNDAENQIEGNEELVQLAVAYSEPCVELEAENDHAQSGQEEKSRARQEGVEPILIVAVSVVCLHQKTLCIFLIPNKWASLLKVCGTGYLAVQVLLRFFPVQSSARTLINRNRTV